jgi:carbonic anhydrase
MKNIKIKIAVVIFFIFSLGVLMLKNEKVSFYLGGAFIDLGTFLQDKAEDFDLEKHQSLTPDDVWKSFLEHNKLSSKVRKNMPLHSFHPLVAMLVCMDARLDPHDISGDSRHFYYVVRTAGSVMNLKEEEMLELAVLNGVKLVIISTHTDCAAEKVAKDPVKSLEFPQITKAIHEREYRIYEFMERPLIKERIKNGSLLVKKIRIRTDSEELEIIDL